MAHPGPRFRDPLHRVQAFLGEVLVTCPRCDHRAVVRPELPPGGARRLVCSECGFDDRTEGCPSVRTDGDRDPYFGAPLWLITECRGHILWAFNTQHLDLLEAYVRAGLRERGEIRGSMSMVERLPAWIKTRKNRAAVLTAIGRLRERAASVTR